MQVSKCVLMCLGCFFFSSLGEILSKALGFLVLFSSKIAALTNVIFSHTELLFISIYKAFIRE